MHIDYLRDLIVRAVLHRCCRSGEERPPEVKLVELLLQEADLLIDRIIAEIRPLVGGDVIIISDPQMLRRFGLYALRPFRTRTDGRDIYLKVGADVADFVHEIMHMRYNPHYDAILDMFANQLTLRIADILGEEAEKVRAEDIRRFISSICREPYIELMNELATRLLVDSHDSTYIYNMARQLVSCLAHSMNLPQLTWDPSLVHDVVKAAYSTLAITLYAKMLHEVNLMPLPYVHMLCEVLNILNNVLGTTVELCEGRINCTDYGARCIDNYRNLLAIKDRLTIKQG